MGEVTRFYDRGSDQDGPVSGALVVIPINFLSVTTATTSTTYVRQVRFPAGMSFEITDVVVRASAVTDEPSLTIGDTVAGTEVVTAVNVTTNLGALTIVDGTIDAGGFIDVRVVNNTTATFNDLEVTIVGHVASPPTSVAYRA